jgi:hypothetical protein
MSNIDAGVDSNIVPVIHHKLICDECHSSTETLQYNARRNQFECVMCAVVDLAENPRVQSRVNPATGEVRKKRQVKPEVPFEQYQVLKCQARFDSIPYINTPKILEEIINWEKTPCTNKRARKRLTKLYTEMIKR